MSVNPVIQTWVQALTFMQQSVLLTAIRGPDGLEKNHVSKALIKWLRRCILYSAFESREQGKPVVITNPWFPGGGGFTGPSCPSCQTEQWEPEMNKLLSAYLQAADSMPHHFQMHIMHASEIIGYCHPDMRIGTWWDTAYKRIVYSMHLTPETKSQMMRRLGDSEKDWMAADQLSAAP